MRSQESACGLGVDTIIAATAIIGTAIIGLIDTIVIQGIIDIVTTIRATDIIITILITTTTEDPVYISAGATMTTINCRLA